jgi:carbon-monoxide dehydrogenase small subunit
LQQKFLEHASLQCGICTPGFLMSAKALLDHNPKPTEGEIRYALAGNLCRCTGYDKIVRAVTDAAQTLTSTAGKAGRLGTGPSAAEQTGNYLREQEVK